MINKQRRNHVLKWMGIIAFYFISAMVIAPPLVSSDDWILFSIGMLVALGPAAYAIYFAATRIWNFVDPITNQEKEKSE